MAYRYKFTPLALSDMDEALDYIAGSLSNPSAADTMYRNIASEIERICDRPFSFSDCSNYLIDDEMIRHTVIGNYVLIFEVCEAEKLIKILRFLYGGRNIAGMSIGT